MAKTYEPIATSTLGSAASSITFSSIPNTYTDLRLVLVGTMSTATSAYMQFNSDTATNYSRTVLSGNGTSATSLGNTNIEYIFISFGDIDTTNPSLMEIDIFSYAGSTYKTALTAITNDKNGSGNASRQVAMWRSTSAITSISLTSNGQNFAIGTTATLYGILKA